MGSLGSRVLGGLAGGAAGVGARFLARSIADEGIGADLGLLVGTIVVVLVLYLIANASHSPGAARNEVLVGLLLGFNAGLSAVLLSVLLGPIAGIVLGIVLALACVPQVAAFRPYHFFLGWSNFVSPMSWLVTGLGLLFFLVSLLLHAVTAGRVNFLKITHILVDWPTGTFLLVGGLVGNANLKEGSTGFNMGNFAFLKGSAGPDPYLVQHESGHTLNLAAFGFVFHFIGALDENVTGGGAEAYSELCAESHVPVALARRNYLPLWGT